MQAVASFCVCHPACLFLQQAAVSHVVLAKPAYALQGGGGACECSTLAPTEGYLDRGARDRHRVCVWHDAGQGLASSLRVGGALEATRSRSIRASAGGVVPPAIGHARAERAHARAEHALESAQQWRRPMRAASHSGRPEGLGGCGGGGRRARNTLRAPASGSRSISWSDACLDVSDT